LTRAHSSVG